MSSNRKPVRRFLFRTILPPIALSMYRWHARSWRYVAENEAGLTALLRGSRPLVGAFLHGRTFALLHYFSLPQNGRWMLMCSPSRDGELMSRLESGLGFRVVRGSSGSGGARALVQMIKAQREDPGLSSCLAIDGSRGPRGNAQLGTITLTQKTNGLLLPVAASAEDYWICGKCWDRMVIPKRGSRVHVLVGEPMEVPARLDAAQLEGVRAALEERLLAMHAELDKRTGFRDSQPLKAAAKVAMPAPGALISASTSGISTG